MINKEIYAVVDLETTRTRMTDGRIIQIAIAFVQKNKIINQFNTLINPGNRERIPKMITQLTGITPKMVADAPFFEDVAFTLHAMLSGTIFVAHNVNFDLPFLNAEFERVGLTSLKNEAIDTEPLSRILWPTAPAYRLRDLTTYLNIEHGHPHQADSDAIATAELLVKIFDKARALPMITLQTLTEMPLVLPMDSRMILVEALAANRQSPEPLPSQLQVVDGLAIRRYSMPDPVHKRIADKFPAKKAAKEKLFGDRFEYRDEQAKMMNLIHTHFNDSELSTVPGQSSLVMEAPTGLGKTLGFLLPMAYLAVETGRKVVVAEPTITMQHQVQTVVEEQLKPLLSFDIRVAVLKGHLNYLNLQSFKRMLKRDEGSIPMQLAKAQMLVWLTETLTGDFDELNLNNVSQEFLARVAQPANNPAASSFAQYEFTARQAVLAEEADFIIVNHAYMVSHHADMVFQLKPYLVIDEAQHLPDTVITQSRHQVNFKQWGDVVHAGLDILAAHHQPSLQSVFERLHGGSRMLTNLRNQLQLLEDQLPKVEQKLYRRFGMQKGLELDHKQVVDSEIELPDLAQFFLDNADLINAIQRAVAVLTDGLETMLTNFAEADQTFSVSERQELADFRRIVGQINTNSNRINQFKNELVMYPTASIFWLSESLGGATPSVRLAGGLLHTTNYFKQRIYPNFMPPVLTGATLFTSKKSGYLFNRFDLDEDSATSYRFGDVFDYAKQSQLLLVKNAPLPTSYNYADYLAEQLLKIADAVEENTLVLFTSNDMIAHVYNRMQNNREYGDVSTTILAQGISGTRNKILRRLETEKPMMVLGSASFWEGIDLPGDQLRLVIMARLPFEQPDNIVAKAEEAVLIAQGRQPFYQSTLPKAILRFRQGVGRLIRSQDDYGAIIVFDSRLISKSYGRSVRNMMPEAMPQLEVLDTEVVPILTDFFAQHE